MLRAPLSDPAHVAVRATAIVVLLTALTGIACILPLKRDKFAKIELGMTEDEVTKIVGKPNAVSKMDSVPPGYEDIPFEDYEVNRRRPPEQFMWTYTSGIEFAQVYFEDKRVFGVRFNNEFLKGDWMEGDRMPEQVLPPASSEPSTAQPSDSTGNEPEAPAVDEQPSDTSYSDSENP